MLLKMTLFHSFLWLRNIPLYLYTTSSLFIHLSTDIQVATKSWLGLPSGSSGKELACQCKRHNRHGFDPWVGKIPWKWAWQPTPVFLTGESHGQLGLGRWIMGYNPYGCKESDKTEATQHSRMWKEYRILRKKSIFVFPWITYRNENRIHKSFMK